MELTPSVSGDTTSTFTLRAKRLKLLIDNLQLPFRDPITQTFSYTGSGQTFTAPVGVSSFTAYMWGVGGAGGSTESNISGTGGNGGAGAYVTVLLIFHRNKHLVF